MKLYDYFRSSASYRVRIALNLKEIHYDKCPVHLIHHGGEQHHPEYLAINPQGLVPTLDENGHILTQSLAIIEYLDEINPTPPLLPHTPLGRAEVRSLAYSIASDIHPLNNVRVIEQLKQRFHADESQIKDWYHHWLKIGFDALEKKLSHLPRTKNVCYGHDVSLADLCLIPQVFNAHRFELAMQHYPLINDINAYCLSLPAFINASPNES